MYYYLTYKNFTDDNILHIEISKEVTDVSIDPLAITNNTDLFLRKLVNCKGFDVKINDNENFDFIDGCLIDKAHKKLILVDSTFKNLPNNVDEVLNYALVLAKVKTLIVLKNIWLQKDALARTKIENIIFEDGTEEIDIENILSKNYGTKTITLPKSVCCIHHLTYYSYNKLSNIIIDKENKHYSSGDNNDCIIRLSTKSLLYTLNNFSKIPNNIENIEAGAVKDKNFNTLRIPNSVKSIKGSGFNKCLIKELIIEGELKEIQKTTFRDCNIYEIKAEKIDPEKVYSNEMRMLLIRSFIKDFKNNTFSSDIKNLYRKIINYDIKDKLNYILIDAETVQCLLKENFLDPENIVCAIDYANKNGLKEIASLLLINASQSNFNKEFSNSNKLFEITSGSLDDLGNDYKFKINKKGQITIEKYIGNKCEVRLPENGEYNITSWKRTAFYNTGVDKIIIPGSYKDFNFGFSIDKAYTQATIIYEEGVETLSADIFINYGGTLIQFPSTLKDIIYNRKPNISYYRVSFSERMPIRIKFPNGNDCFEIKENNKEVYYLYNKVLKKIYFTSDISLIPQDCKIIETECILDDSDYQGGDLYLRNFPEVEEIHRLCNHTYHICSEDGVLKLPKNLSIIDCSIELKFKDKEHNILILPNNISYINDNSFYYDVESKSFDQVIYNGNENSAIYIDENSIIKSDNNTVLLIGNTNILSKKMVLSDQNFDFYLLDNHIFTLDTIEIPENLKYGYPFNFDYGNIRNFIFKHEKNKEVIVKFDNYYDITVYVENGFKQLKLILKSNDYQKQYHTTELYLPNSIVALDVCIHDEEVKKKLLIHITEKSKLKDCLSKNNIKYVID